MMNLKNFCRPVLGALLLAILSVGPVSNALAGPKGTTLFIVRHAEKPADGDGLTPAGEARAQAYAKYFAPLKLGDESLKIDEIFAATDSKHSRRPRLTVEPLAGRWR